MKHILEYNSYNQTQSIKTFVKFAYDYMESTFEAIKTEQEDEDNDSEFQCYMSLYPKKYFKVDRDSFGEGSQDMLKAYDELMNNSNINYIAHHVFQEYGMGTSEEINDYFFLNESGEEIEQKSEFEELMGDAHFLMNFLKDDLEVEFNVEDAIKTVSYEDWIMLTYQTAQAILDLNESIEVDDNLMREFTKLAIKEIKEYYDDIEKEGYPSNYDITMSLYTLDHFPFAENDLSDFKEELLASSFEYFSMLEIFETEVGTYEPTTDYYIYENGKFRNTTEEEYNIFKDVDFGIIHDYDGIKTIDLQETLDNIQSTSDAIFNLNENWKYIKRFK